MIVTKITIHNLSEAMEWLPQQVELFEQQLAEQIPIEARKLVDESTPQGRLYRVGSITKRKSKSLIKIGLKKRGKTRVVAGTRIHRASARGQAWAKLSGRAYRDIKVRQTGRGAYQVRFGAPYIGFLEFNLQRPVVLPAIENAVKTVLNNV